MKKMFFVASAVLLFAGHPVFAQDAASPTPTPAAEKPASKISVEIKVGTALENHEVSGEADNFPADTQQLIGWCRVTGAAPDTQINHVWKLNSEKVASVPLVVKSASFRTYSRKTVAGMKGNWRLEVQDMNGTVLASKDFTVGAEPK